MSRRIVIPCRELVRRYLQQQQSARDIGRIYSCSAATVVRRLHDCGVTRRPGRYQPRELDEGELVRLYVDERLPLTIIARQLSIAVGTVSNRLRALGVPPRDPIPHRLTLQALWSSGLSVDTAARLARVGPGAVIAAITNTERRPVFSRLPPPAAEQRAYVTGLGQSWLGAQRADDDSGTVVVYAACQQLSEQILFAGALGSTFRQVVLGSNRVVYIVVLPGTWSFLLASEDRLPNWLRGEPRLIHALLAGLVDGAGFVTTSATGARLVVELMAPGLLRGVANELATQRIRSAIRLVEPAPPGLWRLQISNPDRRLLAALAPYLHHPLRREEVQALDKDT